MTKTMCLVSVLAFLGCGGDDDGGSDGGGDDGGVDLYDGLMSVSEGEVSCRDASCCFGRCGGNRDLVCATHDAAAIAGSVRRGEPPVCDTFVFPEWLYNHDCYIGTGGIVGPGHPSRAGNPLTYNHVWSADDSTLQLFVQCFCGRDSSSFASESSAYLLFRLDGCEEPLVLVEYDTLVPIEPPAELITTCDNPCRTCTPTCAGRTCGSDGCGGTCGSCAAGQTCSATGNCTTSGDTCSSCLSACRGLPSCCTGCGCICEDACGQCF